MLKVVAITGRFCSGKSTVSSLLRELGVRVMDVDDISHAITGVAGAALSDIVEQFGVEYIRDGCLDRNKMRQLILSQPDAKCSLERILHPMILQALGEWLALQQPNTYYAAHHNSFNLEINAINYVVIVVPLLFSVSEFAALSDYTVFVNCEDDIAVQRSRISLEQTLSILKLHMPAALQRKLADHVIDNSGTRVALQQQVIDFDRFLR